MAERSRRARVIHTSPDAPDDDLGEKQVIIRDIVGGRPGELHATFEHKSEIVTGTITKIEPADWESRPEAAPVMVVVRDIKV